MEVSESVCADQFATFDSLVSSMPSEIGNVILKLGGFHFFSDAFKESKLHFVSILLVQFVILNHLLGG